VTLIQFWQPSRHFKDNGAAKTMALHRHLQFNLARAEGIISAPRAYDATDCATPVK
jgi:hypothetical protein